MIAAGILLFALVFLLLLRHRRRKVSHLVAPTPTRGLLSRQDSIRSAGSRNSVPSVRSLSELIDRIEAEAMPMRPIYRRLIIINNNNNDDKKIEENFSVWFREVGVQPVSGVSFLVFS